MNSSAAALFVLLLSCACLGAAERTIQTRDGKTFTKAEITEVGPVSVKISHDGGISVVPMENLPREIQKEIGYKTPADRQVEAERMDEENKVKATIDSQQRDDATKTAKEKKLKDAFYAIRSASQAEANVFAAMSKDQLVERLGEPVSTDHSGAAGNGITTLFYDERKLTRTVFVIRDGETVISAGTYKGVPVQRR